MGPIPARSCPPANRCPLLAPPAIPRVPAGLLWKASLAHPTLWTEPSEPRSVVEPVLPNGLALEGDSNDDSSSGHAAAVGYREVSPSEEEVGSGYCSRVWLQLCALAGSSGCL